MYVPHPEFREYPDQEQLAVESVTLIRVPPHSDFEQGTGHYHEETEEVYLLTRGTLTFRLGDDIHRDDVIVATAVWPDDESHDLRRRWSDRLGITVEQLDENHHTIASNYPQFDVNISETAYPAQGGTPLSFSPVLDGKYLPHHPFDPSAPLESAEWILEGGAIDGDGSGTVTVLPPGALLRCLRRTGTTTEPPPGAARRRFWRINGPEPAEDP